MKAVNWQSWMWQYLLPIAILVLSVPLTYLIADGVLGHEDPDIFWVLVIAPIIAFLIGFVVRPKITWVIPIVAVVMFEVAVAAGRGIDAAAETSFAVVALLGLPMWFLIWAGQRARPWFEERVASRRHDELNPPAG